MSRVLYEMKCRWLYATDAQRIFRFISYSIFIHVLVYKCFHLDFSFKGDDKKVFLYYYSIMTLSTYRQAHSIAIKYRGIMIPFENSYPLFVKKKNRHKCRCYELEFNSGNTYKSSKIQRTRTNFIFDVTYFNLIGFSHLEDIL